MRNSCSNCTLQLHLLLYNDYLLQRANEVLINVLISGKDNVFLLSQYIGEPILDFHLKGSFGCKIIALICNKDLSNLFTISISYIMTQKYKVYINNEAKIVTENWTDFCSNYKIIGYCQDWFLITKIKY